MRRNACPRSAVGFWLSVAAAGAALSVAAPMPWVGAGFAVSWLLFFCAGAAWIPAAWLEPAADPPALAALRAALLATLAGLASALVAWFVSALAFKALLPGSIGLLCLAVSGAWRWRDQRSALAQAAAPEVVAVTLLALALGLHIAGRNELVDGDDWLFTFRFDWDMHLFWAALVREYGLPLVEPTGSSAASHAPLYHLGLHCLLPGIEALTRTSLYQAARILAVGCYPLIALCGLCLVSRSGLSAAGRVVCSLSALVWGGLSLPLELARHNWPGLSDPYLAGLLPFLAPSGSAYHNLPQLVCVALGGGALVALDAQPPEGRRAHWCCGALLAGSALVKPSLAIVVVPALLSVLLIERAGVRAVLSLTVPLAAGALLYVAPALLEPLGPGVRWTVHGNSLRSIDPWLQQLLVWGIALPLVAHRLVRFLACRPGRDASARDVLYLGCVGGAVFWVGFVEPERSDHANHVWSLQAALILAAPLLSSSLLSWVRRGWSRSRAARCAAVIGVVLWSCQLASGLAYALHYPSLGWNRVPRAQIEAVQALARSVPATSRVLADQTLLVWATRPYFPRPVLDSDVGVQHIDAEVQQWVAAQDEGSGGDLSALLDTRDAVILGPRTRYLQPKLEALSWHRRTEVPGYELWLRAAPAGRSP